MRFVLDINHIREQLNQLPFRDGKREVFVGKISELFGGEDGAEISGSQVADELRQCEQELQKQTLSLTRHENDRDSLFVVQELRTIAPDLSWMSEAMKWVSQITTVALEMILPGLAGMWLDRQLGTPFLALLGFVLGVPLGMWHLIKLTRDQRNETVHAPRGEPSDERNRHLPP